MRVPYGYLMGLGLLALQCNTSVDSNNEQTAILKLLEKESATWRSGDEKAHADCWQIQPYSTVLVSIPDGHCYDIDPNLMIHPAKGSMGKGGYATASHFKFNMQGTSAWVAHDEVSTAPDSSKTYSHEIRLLEKFNGQWKLVGQSIHLYKP